MSSQSVTPHIVALVPAHDEEESIGATLDSIFGQSVKPTRIVVVADNCSDRTAEIAAGRGVEVVHTVGNRYRKAGALNFALSAMLPELPDDALVLIMDADTTLTPDWMREASRWLLGRPDSGAVCAVYRGRDLPGMLPTLQRMDYAQEARRVGRRRSRVDVLTGVATLFSAGVLRQVAAERGRALRGRHGDVYDMHSLTEDFELTLAIKSLGYQPISPQSLVAVTDVMRSWSDLRRQRLRWQRGTIDTLVAYGFNSLTRRHWINQVSTYGLTLVFPLMVALLIISWAVAGFYFQPWWSLTLPLFYAEHILVCWRMGGQGRRVALCLLPFWIYENFRILVFWSALSRSVFRREKRWA